MQAYTTYALVGICSILIIFAYISDSLSRKRKRMLFLLAFTTLILLIADRHVAAFNGDPSVFGGWILRTSKFLTYLMNLLIVYEFSQYLKDMLLVEGNLEEVPKTLKIADCITLVGITVLVLAQFTDVYYTFDENNVYHHCKGYPVSYVFPAISIIILASDIIKYRKNLRKRLFLPLLLFTVSPLGASILHLLYPRTTLTSAAIVAMVVLLYCFSILDANEVMRTAHEKEVTMLLEKQKDESLMLEQTTLALADTIDAKDKYTSGHSRRVAEYSVMIAEKAGKTEEECKEIYLTALLHDIGKIAIPDAIINKEGKLTDEEYAIIKTHPQVGRDILSKISISPELAIGASFHHERYDGKGYPFGLKGEEIHETARIIAVADTFDAMTSKRSYRDGLPKEKVISELLNGKGTQFDPKFAEIMVDLCSTLSIWASA